jgi:hypothetical protein
MNGFPPVGPSHGAKGVSGSSAAGPKAEIKGPSVIGSLETASFSINTEAKNVSRRWAILNSDGKDKTSFLIKYANLTISDDGSKIDFRPPGTEKFTIRAWVTNEKGTTMLSRQVDCQ